MLRNNVGRARVARLVFLLFMLLAGALLVISLLGQTRPDWNEAATQGAASTFTTGLYYGHLLLSLGYLVLIVASYVVLILWLRRAYYNLHQLPNIHPAYSDGWAAGAWFVPFLNFVRPYTITREVWLDTQRAAWGHIVRPATLVGWWWAAFVLKMVVGRITSHMGDSNSDYISQNDLLATTLEAGVQLVACTLTWRLIGQAAEFEAELALHQQLHEFGCPAAPALGGDQADYALEEGY